MRNFEIIKNGKVILSGDMYEVIIDGLCEILDHDGISVSNYKLLSFAAESQTLMKVGESDKFGEYEVKRTK